MPFLFILVFSLVLVLDASSHHLSSSTVNCENQHKLLKLEKNASGIVAPFAHGHSKDAFFATLLGHPVVVKRPRNDFLDEKLKNAVKEFTQELDRVKMLRGGHPGIPSYFGSCLTPRAHHGEDLVLVTEKLRTWWEFHEDSSLKWCQRVYSSISQVSLARFLQGQWDAKDRPKAAGFLHCSINRAQFAYGPHGETKLIDYGGLHRFDSFPQYQGPCKKDEDCASACMRSWAKRRHGAIGEFQCDRHKGQCRGFDPAANLWVLCASMMSELLMPERLKEAKGGGQHLNTAPVEKVLHKCTALHKRDRISARELHETLVRFLLDNDKRYPCMKKVGLKPDPIYMNFEKPLKSL